MLCQICGKDFLESRLSTHVTRTHKISAESYFISYIGEKGKCLTCGNNTTFISLTKGYCKFCCNQCVGKNKDIQERKKKTTRSHFNVDWPTQSKKVQETKVNTLKQKYGCTNAFNIDYIKEKAQKNSHTAESNKKRNESQSKTKKLLWSQPEYRQNILNKCNTTNLQNFGTSWSSNSDIVRSKISNTVKSEDCQNRTKQTCLVRYGVQHHTQSRHYIDSAKKRYVYNNITFDSSWELALYIYAKDHNISIIRCPCQIKYYDVNNILHYYTPDFLLDNKLVEVKGSQFFNEKGELVNIYTKTVRSDLMKCMKDHNVTILRYDDVKVYIEYCINTYKNDWPSIFRKK